MANTFISADDIKALVIGAAGDFTGGLLSSLLLARKIGHRFQPDEQKQALREALEQALTEACKLFPEAQKSVTKYYLEQLSNFLQAQIVVAEIGKLLDPSPTTLLEKELLSQEFTRITQGYSPDQIPDLDFDLFVETLVYSFYIAVKSKEPLRKIIQIERLDQIVQHFIKTFSLLETLLASSEGTSRGIAELILIARQQAETLEEIKALLKEQRDGLRQFPHFATPIENFLISYLGTDKEPVPFGGRDEQLEELERWRNESSRQRLLLVAPAGRGKSALLVRWSQMLVNQEDVAVLFMPISARFGTNREEVTFACLAVSLARLYGKEIPTDFAHFTPQLWRGLVADYLRESLPDGQQLLMILDGLDEATWEGYEDIFPLQLPSGVRLVVSARYRAGEAVSPVPWLQRLGWDRFTDLAETLTLTELTPEGVRDVLIKMGCPLDELGTKVDIVAELHRLSEGDPLLVELYVKDLWSRGGAVTRLKPQDLQEIRPGYEGFFDKWWADQEKLWGRERPLLQNLTRTLLNLLAAAWGPLLLDDVLAILAEDPLVDGLHLQEALKPLARFVYGDGHEQGYVFSHPRLGDYFWEGQGHREQTRWEDLFIHWGQTTLNQLEEAQLQYEGVSLYLLQYHISHLRRSEANLDSHLCLLSYQWMQAWHKRTGTYSGFLRDVDQVWAQLRQANKVAVAEDKVAPYLGMEIRCALYHASIHSLAENLPNDLLVQLLTYRIWTEEQVLAYARQKHNIIERCQTLIQIAQELSPKQHAQILTEVVEMSNIIENGRDRVKVLTGLVPHLPQEVLTAASTIENERDRAEILTELAPHLPQEVLAAASTIEDEWDRVHILSTLAPHQPQEVLTAVSAFEDEWDRVRILTALAPHLPQEVLIKTSTTKNERDRAEVLTELAPHLPQEVLPATSAIEDEESRTKVLVALAPHLSQEVLTAAGTIENGEDRTKVLTALASHLPQEVLAAVGTIEDGEYRAKVLTALASHLPQKVLAAAGTIEVDEYRAEVLTALVPHLPQEVLTTASVMENEGYRARVMTALAPHLPQEVLTAANAMENGRDRVHILTALAPYQPQEVMTAISVIKNGMYGTEVLTALAPHLPQEVLTAANAIENGRERAEVLTALAPHLPQEMQAEALNNALVVAGAIKDEEYRIRVLTALAPHLPQEVLAAASTVEVEGYRVRVLTALAPHLPQEVLAAASTVEAEEYRILILTKLAPYLPQQVLTAGSPVEYDEYRIYILVALAPHLPQEVLAAASAIENERDCAGVLTALAPHLPQEVLTAANAIEVDEYRIRILTALAPHLPQEVLTATRTIENERDRAQVLTELAPHLPQEVLTAASTIEDGEYRVRVLTALAPHLPQETLTAAGVMENEGYRIRVLTALAPHLPQEVLTVASTIEAEGYRVRVLTALAPHLPQEVLTTANAIENGRDRAEVLTALAPHLPQKVQAEALNNALTAVGAIKDEEYRARVLIALAPHLPQQVLNASSTIEDARFRAQIIVELIPFLLYLSSFSLYSCWQNFLRISANRSRLNLLSDIGISLPVINHLGGQEALSETLQAIKDVTQWWP